MKKLLFIFFLFLSYTSAFSQNVVREGNNFTSVSTKSNKSSDVETKFTWTDKNGNVFPIYISKTGSCYVKRISQKTNQEYKYYLGKEISAQISKELGIKYEPKTKNN